MLFFPRQERKLRLASAVVDSDRAFEDDAKALQEFFDAVLADGHPSL